MTKWLLDVHVESDSTTVSLYDENTRTIETRPVDLVFYGYIAGEDPERLATDVRGVDDVLDAWVEEWRIPPFYESTMRIVVFKTKRIRALRYIYGVARSKGLRVINTVPHPLIEALYRSRIRPLTRVKNIAGNHVELYEWNPLERDPDLDYVVVDIENGLYTARTGNDVTRFAWIKDLAEYLSMQRYHLGFIDPCLYAKLIETEPSVKSSARWVTGGSFSPHEYFEWSRLSYTPLSLMSNVTIGRILTTIEVLHARSRKLVVDKSTGRREPWRSMNELLVYDRGGVVYQPRPGLYWNVCQVDFKSLYPSIMVRYNVSGETVDRPVCLSRLRLEWTPHSVCLDEEGVVPASLRALLDLKDLYEDLYRRTGDETYAERKSAVKWILVASFGYLGYRNSLFGSVMAHEVVTSTSREVMRRARIAVEREGYRVVHAIVDSLFIEGVKSVDECLCLKEKIEKTTGFRAKLEAHYTWLYIPRSLRGEEGVANRYYGLLSDGSWKIKGILSVRRDTPLAVARAQTEALRELFKARSPGEFSPRLIEAHRVIDKYIEMIKHNEIDPVELVITRGCKSRGDYRKSPPCIANNPPPYRLIYTSSGLSLLERTEIPRVDIDKYIELLEKARRELPSLRDLSASVPSKASYA